MFGSELAIEHAEVSLLSSVSVAKLESYVLLALDAEYCLLLPQLVPEFGVLEGSIDCRSDCSTALLAVLLRSSVLWPFACVSKYLCNH